MRGEKWILKHGSQLVNLQATVAELDMYRDGVVVFEAIKTSNASRLPSRQPLQPTNNQVLSPPDKSRPSQILADVKTPIPAPRNLIPRPLDENSIFQPKPYPPQVHTECSQPPANVGSYTNTPSPTTTHCPSPNVSYRSSSALQMGSHPPSNKIPFPAPHLVSPARSASISMRASNMSSSTLGSDAAQLGPLQVSNCSGSKPKANSDQQRIPAMDKPPISPAEVDDQHQTTFQLQTLLNDASPQMLEASVEQGVKLLDRLKGPMVEKLQNGVDAGQWIQQIGKWLFRSFSADLGSKYYHKITCASKLLRPRR